jgi:hypothetical protein
VLRKKLFNVGFAGIEVADRAPFGLEALTRYPLFPPEFVDFVRAVVPVDRHDTLLSSVVLTARKPVVQEGDS